MNLLLTIACIVMGSIVGGLILLATLLNILGL